MITNLQRIIRMRLQADTLYSRDRVLTALPVTKLGLTELAGNDPRAPKAAASTKLNWF
jgi:hypothetical protein